VIRSFLLLVQKKEPKKSTPRKPTVIFSFRTSLTPLSRKNNGSHFSWTAAAPAYSLGEWGIRITFGLEKEVS
jgi:hypothetical protein